LDTCWALSIFREIFFTCGGKPSRWLGVTRRATELVVSRRKIYEGRDLVPERERSTSGDDDSGQEGSTTSTSFVSCSPSPQRRCMVEVGTPSSVKQISCYVFILNCNIFFSLDLLDYMYL
jgi:hypothetical protein